MKNSNKQRRKNEKLYGHLYSMASVDNRLICAYCGDTRGALDHIPPLSRAHQFDKTLIKILDIEFVLYPSCTACNSALGEKPIYRFEERCLFLYEKLQLKMNTVTLWHVDEINELEGHLKTMVKARQLQIRRELINRIRGLERTIATFD